MSRRYFDKNFDILLRPAKKQIMLDKFCSNPDYSHFLTGKIVVEAYTATKEQLEGRMELKAHGCAVFTCMTPGMPEMKKGSLLLFVLEKEPQMLLVQAAVDAVVDQSIMLAKIDPRRRARYRTRMVVFFHGVARAAYDHLKNHTARAFRQEDAAKDKYGKPFIAKIYDKIEDYAKIVHDANNYVGKGKVPMSALMADISEAGCCLHIPKDLEVDGLAETRLIFLMLELPLPARKVELKVLASVRGIRNYGDSRVLHCMFIEPLPQGCLDF
jgi:hypothetical protein